MVNAIKKPANIPGFIWGKIILRIAYAGVAPKSNAASVILAGNCLSFGNIDKITYGILKVIWARSKVVNPNSNFK